MNQGHLAKHGFSLLEMLVALAIVGVSISLLYRVSGGSLRAIGQIETQQRAAVLLDSLLSSKDAVSPEGWNADGESAGFSWRVRSELMTSVGGDEGQTRLHKVWIAVLWREGDRLRELQAVTALPQFKARPGDSIR